MWRVLCFFGSRPELAELVPVLRALEARRARMAALHVAACERPSPLDALAQELGVRIDRRLSAASEADALSGVLAGLDPLLARERPDLLVVQGDSAQALAAALAAALRGIPVARIGPGLCGVLWLDGVPDAPRPGPAAASAHPDDAGERIAAELERWLEGRPAGVPASAPTGGARPLALEDFVEAAKRQIAEISPEDARRILEAPGREGWHFVDVREPDEFAEGHIPGARSFPRGFLEVRADLAHYKRDAWLEDRGRKLILYCGGGHRSALAVHTLQQMGFASAVSLREGWTGWTQRAYPVEK